MDESLIRPPKARRARGGRGRGSTTAIAKTSFFIVVSTVLEGSASERHRRRSVSNPDHERVSFDDEALKRRKRRCGERKSARRRADCRPALALKTTSGSLVRIQGVSPSWGNGAPAARRKVKGSTRLMASALGKTEYEAFLRNALLQGGCPPEHAATGDAHRKLLHQRPISERRREPATLGL